MAKEEKKPKTVDDIVADYQKFHYKAGKSFKDRIKKWEEFHDPENIHLQQFIQHAHYTVFGKPDDFKSFPGAYNEAYRILSKNVEDDNGKLEDEDKLAQILEGYVDTFMQKAIGDKFKKMMEHAEKEEKLSKKDLRELKGQLMSQYYSEDGEHPTNILSENYIKALKGKKKIELVSKLQDIGQKSAQHFASTLRHKALEGLITDEDRLEMTKYITPIFKERGWKHKYSHITRSAEEQAQHYALVLQGAGDKLREAGYKAVKYEKKEEKKK